MSRIPYIVNMETVKVIAYSTGAGKEPFDEWIHSLDKTARSIVSGRILRIRDGNFGVCKPIKGFAGIYELVIDYGPGYRIYYGKKGDTIVILLVGGEKKSQIRDIEKAYRYWLDYKGL